LQAGTATKGVLAAFEPARHAEPGSSASLQIPRLTLASAAANGFAAARKTNGELAVALRTDLLPTYLSNQSALYAMGEAEATTAALHLAAEGEVPPVAALAAGPDLEERARVLAILAKAVRSSTFRKAVLSAYEHKCAACVDEMQLRLVQAAHLCS
jgi:putative restriction endonuclease